MDRTAHSNSTIQSARRIGADRSAAEARAPRGAFRRGRALRSSARCAAALSLLLHPALAIGAPSALGPAASTTLAAGAAVAQAVEVNINTFGNATHIVVPTAQAWELRDLSQVQEWPEPGMLPDGPTSVHPPRPMPVPPIPPQPPRPPRPGHRHPHAPAVAIERTHFDTTIRDGAATTTMDLLLRNTGGGRAEAVLLLPLPFDAAVTAMELEGLGSEGAARILPRDEARRIYDAIVSQVRDPALVEFAGWNLVRSSVFPIEAGGTQRVRLTFDHILDVDGDRIDLLLPRSETLPPTGSWSITVDATCERPIVEAYSPTHPLQVERVDGRHLIVKAAAPRPVPGPFRLSLLRAPAAEASPLGTTVMLSPDPAGGGGQFLILGGLDPRVVEALAAGRRAPRELILVLDRSGSMRGEKLQQARDTAISLVDRLRDGDFLNIVDFSTTVGALFERPVAVTPETRQQARRHLERLAPGGGTNIHDALVEALAQPPSSAALRTVLFLTDGLPTVGRTVEGDVRAAVEKGNAHARRVHVLGVGVDVNAPLLDRIGDLTRGSTTYVAPGDSIVLAAGRLARVLDGPALLGPTLTSIGPSGIADVLPAMLPDLHAGEQLVILGRYVDGKPVTVRLEGSLAAGEGANERIGREIVIDPAKATVRHAFVGRLWATRQIALLADEVRQLTAPGAAAVSPADPRLRELTEQIVALSLRWGVLTEYTSFLAAEPGAGAIDALAVPVALRELHDHAWNQLESMAVNARSGAAGVAQGMNYNARKLQSVQNLDNCFKDGQLRDVTTTEVCQVADRGFFKRGGSWIDGTLVAAERQEPRRTIEFGTPEYVALVDALCRVNRQSVLALRGDVVLDVDGETVLVKNAS